MKLELKVKVKGNNIAYYDELNKMWRIVNIEKQRIISKRNSQRIKVNKS